MPESAILEDRSAIIGGRPANEAVETRQRDRRHVWHPWSPLAADRSETTFTHGAGYRVWDIEGREYIDAASLNATCGYGHPAVVEAAHRQLERFHGTDLSLATHEPAGLLAERIANYLPRALHKTLFVNSGSEAFDAAVFIAASYWAQIGEPRQRIVTFARGYHGSTLLSRSLTGLPRVGHPFAKPFPITHVDLPLPPRDLWHADALPSLLNAFRDALDADPSAPPMAVVVEPFLNVGGGVVLPKGFLSGLRALCDERGALLIVDEVFTGYGRSGKMFAIEHDEMEPDILVSSKGLAGGYLPIAAVTVQEDIHESFAQDPHIGGLRYGHTTSGHAVACAAALATFDVMERENLVDRAATLGDDLLARLRAASARGAAVDVRGLGLIAVVEMDNADMAARVLSRARTGGLLMRQHGEVLMIVPPLTVDGAGIEAIADRFEHAVTGA